MAEPHLLIGESYQLVNGGFLHVLHAQVRQAEHLQDPVFRAPTPATLVGRPPARHFARSVLAITAANHPARRVAQPRQHLQRRRTVIALEIVFCLSHYCWLAAPSWIAVNACRDPANSMRARAG